jgi:hypothetical protein
VERIAHREEGSLGVLRRALYVVSVSTIALCIWTTVTMQHEVATSILDGELTLLDGTRTVSQEVLPPASR